METTYVMLGSYKYLRVVVGVRKNWMRLHLEQADLDSLMIRRDHLHRCCQPFDFALGSRNGEDKSITDGSVDRRNYTIPT